MRLIFATQNQHKRDEVQALAGHFVQIISLRDLHFTEELPETHNTLEENALEKAQFISRKFDTDCFSEDTGLEIDALQGAPGVFSARYAGEEKSSDDNISKVLTEMQHQQNRKARFRTVICLLLKNQPHYFEGIVNGTIAEKPSGASGFGYDPVFIPEGSKLTFAEMSADSKNSMSHRYKATVQLLDWLKNNLK